MIQEITQFQEDDILNIDPPVLDHLRSQAHVKFLPSDVNITE